MDGGQRPGKVFLSYRSTDRAVVEEFAARLLRDGVDVWFDRWEVEAGDDIVARMDRGIDGCTAGLIFLSREWFDGRWAQDEYTSLIFRRVVDDIRLIPVMTEDIQERLPTRLRKLARRPVVDYEAIRDTLLGIDHRPGTGTALAARTRSVTLRLEDAGQNRAMVSLLVDGQLIACETEVRVPGGLRLDGLGPAAFAGVRQQVGAMLLSGAVGRAGDELLAGLDASTVADVYVEACPALAAVPFEVVLTPEGRTPVLLSGVRMRRGVLGRCPQRVAPAAGPLKILVAVGAPDEQQTRLDIEAEMGSILDAVAPAVHDDRAQVRILEVANADTITAALAEDDYHVLHLSGHGDEAGIELETEDGAPKPTRAADLADALRAAGRVVPLVFLSSCRGAGDPEGLALALHRSGVPRVIAMQAPVDDRYATELAAAFYRQLSIPAFPRVGVALARARQELAQRTPGESADVPSTEWAAATLTATDDGPLIDGDLDLVALRRPPVHLATGPVPALGMGELIGRRVQVRQTLRTLRGESGPARSVVLTGLGGVGKSSVAGRVMARLTEAGWVCSATTGAWRLDTACTALCDDLLAARPLWARELHGQLAALSAGDAARLRFLGRVLRQHPVLLVLDNFEDNLTPDGAAFTDPGTAAVIEQLADAGTAGRLLVTSRYPLPGLRNLLQQLDIGPLSPGETRRLVLRLAGLRTLTGDDLALVHRLVGGHPRLLEFLDALRRRGASTDRVRRRFEDLADAHDIDVTRCRELGADVAVAVQLGARDICLELLLTTLDDTEYQMLLQTAVSSLPVPLPDLAETLTEAGLDAAAITSAARRLADLSLVVHTDGELWVHRWTAECLRAHQSPEDYRQLCHRAGELRLRRLASASRNVEEGIEATQNLLDAQDWDRAVQVAVRVVDFLDQKSHLGLLSFAGQVLTALSPQHPDHYWFAHHKSASLIALGFTDEAVEGYRHLVSALTQRTQAEPERADYQSALSVFYCQLGGLYASLGQGGQALQQYQQALEIDKRLTRAEPRRADYQHNLSVTYNKLGNLHRSLGQGGQALQQYQQALEIAERLVQTDPGHVDYQRDLSISYERLGNLYQALGQNDQALQLHQQSLDIRTRLAHAEPHRADYQCNLSNSYERLGDVYMALGQIEQTLQLYQQSLDIRAELAKAEPGRTDYQISLSISYRRLGICFAQLNLPEEAAATLEQYLHLALEVYQRMPGQVDAIVDLATALCLTADPDDSRDERNRQARGLLEALEAEQRLPANGRALLDGLRQGQTRSALCTDREPAFRLLSWG